MINKIKLKIKKLLANIWWFFYKLGVNKMQSNIDLPFTIGITTFLDRYNLFFKTLLKQITILFPGVKIIVAVNGHVNRKKQITYLKNIKKFCKKFENVFLISFIDPQGLSRLWNLIIENSPTDKVLLLNDDLYMYPTFQKDFVCSGILQEEIATINSIWSHFLISKSIIEKIGKFDEGLVEIGGEDDDYLARLAISGIYPKDFKIKSINNFSHKLKINSYGKDMTTSKTHSEVNTKYLYNKWIISDKYFDESVYSRGLYWKLANNKEN